MTQLQREALRLIAEERIFPGLVREEDGWYARWSAYEAPGNPWVDTYVREAAVTPLTADAEDHPHRTLHDAWLAALRSRTGLVRWDEAECAAFAAELGAWHGEADGEIRRALVFRFRAEPEGFFLDVAPAGDRRSLKALGEATYVYGPLRELRRNGDRLTAALSREEAELFLADGARSLVAAGYTVEGVELGAAVTAEGEILTAESESDRREERLRLVIRVAGEPVTLREVKFLLDQGSSLVFFRNRWIEIDRDLLRCACRALEKQSGTGRLKRMDALRFAFGLGRFGGLDISELKAHGWLRGLVNSLRSRGGDAVQSPRFVSPFHGTLRDYQVRGVAWIGFLAAHGFGALLADDMGLGKTIQTLAWIATMTAKRRGGRPFALIVAPLTLVANWRHEIAIFTPELAESITVTSYQRFVRDYGQLTGEGYEALVLDEAQTIKNPDTRAARAACAFGAKYRLALTGTPVENTASDVWSIEEFLNPGFLGPRREFEERLVKGVAFGNAAAASTRLRHALEPFLLRRLKSDPAIAAELGEKHIVREYCALGEQSRRDYERALADYRASEHRAGDAFALITELKLICDGEGKLQRLVALLEEIFAAGESALVFSQYAKVGARLKEELDRHFHADFPFLHGSLAAAEREAQIRRFNRGRSTCFILSLKAGGYGLNLTKATHVVHFDRWWNPAVENQATDRAHRIGQSKTVFVHRFITPGTIEERVDRLLESKSALATELVTSGESFLLKLKRDELLDFAALEVNGDHL